MKETFPFNGNKNHNYGGACLSIIINFMNNVILIISNTKKTLPSNLSFFCLFKYSLIVRTYTNFQYNMHGLLRSQFSITSN